MNLIEHDGGRPYWVDVAPGESLKAAIAAIPDEVLVEAFEHEWNSRGIDPPRHSAGDLRRRILASWRRIDALATKGERELPVSEAARELGIPARTLRDRINEGAVPGASVNQRGLLVLALPRERSSRFPLIPHRLRPEARIERGAP